MKVRVTDPNSPYCGQEFDGGCIYYDIYHTGSSPDLFIIKTPEGSMQLLSTQIDAEHYWNQRRQEEIERLGADVGDTVIITRPGSGCFSSEFDCSQPHIITKIDSSGYVEFDNGAAKMFRPDVRKERNPEDTPEMLKAQLVELFEKAHPEMTLKKYVTEVLGYKCCETWGRDELIDEFGYGYCFYMKERKPAEVLR